MRKGFDGLALLVQETLKRDPHGGHLFVFRGRRGGLIKVLWHDGQGLCLFAKRLERGRFIWPSPGEGLVTISSAQLGYLLEGIDICRGTLGSLAISAASRPLAPHHSRQSRHDPVRWQKSPVPSLLVWFVWDFSWRSAGRSQTSSP